MKFITFLCFSIVCVSGIEFKVDPLVITNQGLVRGLRSSDGSYSSFLGIPYALVDLNNPFGPAQQHPGFGSDVFNAYYGLVKCPQVTPRVSTNGYEILDCLRLNVYSPTIASSQNPLPVLVWIHGGDFSRGFAGEYGPEHLVKQNIIVVTINYRLGPYGFICLDIPSVPGNQGLKDQYEALVWIRNNIAAFGGNPYNITIAGQEAGASSVLLHLFSDKEKVYSKVIAESGTPQSMGTVVDGDVDAALKLAGHLGFNTTDSVEALSFLSRSSHELVTAAAFHLGLYLKPCKEKSFSGINNFIENYPVSLSNENKVQNTPILIGHTSREVSDLSTKYDNSYFESDPFYNNVDENFNLDDDKLVEAANIIRNFYIGDEPVSKRIEPELEEFDSDVSFYHPLQRTIAQLLNENANPIFLYEFSYSENGQDVAGHGDELKYLFHMLNNRIESNEKNQLITDRIAKLWSNFVKYGNPTPQTNELLPMTWTPVTANTRPYIVIDTDIRIEHRKNKERMAFWDLFYVAYGQYNRYSRECDI